MIPHKEEGKAVALAQSEAEKIYTIHGFVNEFAMDLNKLGFSAQPLREISLDNFC